MSALRTVLIVENDQATCRMYERALQQEYDVLTASLEDDLSALLKAHTLHAVVLEPGPVDGRGWDLLAELKCHPNLQAVPIVLCTVQDERRRGLESGAAVYLVKPVLPAVLLETVRRLTHPETTLGGPA